ncbi:hypothetical protein BJ742DRAFT_906083 [Cladochytrium replicatum]|nr:hypothetical protein BJ742DRAFT_906083 [Cladochytrium replicatum]
MRRKNHFAITFSTASRIPSILTLWAALIEKEWIAESTVEVRANELRNADCHLRLPEYEALVGVSSGPEYEDRDNRRRTERSSLSPRQSHAGSYPAPPPIAERRTSAPPKENRPPLPFRGRNTTLKISTSPPPYSPNPAPRSSSPAAAAAAVKASPISATMKASPVSLIPNSGGGLISPASCRDRGLYLSQDGRYYYGCYGGRRKLVPGRV